MTKAPSRVPKGQTIYAKAHHLDGEDHVDGLELTLSSSVNGQQKLGDGTMELPFEGKVSGVRKKGQSAWYDEGGAMSDLLLVQPTGACANRSVGRLLPEYLPAGWL